MAYVDGFVIPIKKKNLKAYQKMASEGGKMWMKYGALQYFECVGDDLYPDTQGMKMIPFPKLTKMKKDETVLFSFIIYKSRAHRDAVNKKVMGSMNPDDYKEMPFDTKRMTFGGFESIVNR